MNNSSLGQDDNYVALLSGGFGYLPYGNNLGLGNADLCFSINKENMYKFIMISLLLITNCSIAQSSLENMPKERKGFIMGLGLGAGTLSLNTDETTAVSFSASLPNIKVGYMIGNDFALLTLLPGATYKHQEKDRGFEGVIIAGQYWLKNKWWILAGAGMTFDAPAFYTVKELDTADFNTGFPAYTLATGYKVWNKGKFVIDLQYRIFLGSAKLSSGSQRHGIANMFILGFNWN